MIDVPDFKTSSSLIYILQDKIGPVQINIHFKAEDGFVQVKSRYFSSAKITLVGSMTHLKKTKFSVDSFILCKLFSAQF
jgi:hypothetical protein